MDMTGKPLNGEKTHPLSEHAKTVLRVIMRQPLPVLDVNPGVRDRFDREHLVETVMLPSPYKSHKGAKCAHLQITAAGRRALGAA